MDTYGLIYPSGIIVRVEAKDEQEARDLGFTFGQVLEETPAEEVVETKQAA